MEQKPEEKKNEKPIPESKSEAKVSKANEKSAKKHTTQTKATTSHKKVVKTEKKEKEPEPEVEEVKREVVEEEEEIQNIVKNELSMAPTINKNVLFKEIVNKPQHTLNYKKIVSHTVVKPVIVEEVKTRKPIIMSGSMNFNGLESMNDEEILKQFFSNNSEPQTQNVVETNNNFISRSYFQPSHQQVNSGLSAENQNNFPQNYSVNYHISIGNEQSNYYNNINKQVSQAQQVQKKNIILSHKNNVQTNANLLNQNMVQNIHALNANPNAVLHQNNVNNSQMKISNSVILNQNNVNVKNNINLRNSQNTNKIANIQNNKQKIIKNNPNPNASLNNNQSLSKSTVQKTQNAKNIAALAKNNPQQNINTNAALNLRSVQEQNQIQKNVQKVQNSPNIKENNINNINNINLNTSNAAQSKLPQKPKVESREEKILFHTNVKPLGDALDNKLTRSEIKENKIEIQTDNKNSILLSDEKVSPNKKLYRTNILSKSLRPVVKMENVTVNNILRATYAKLLKQKKIEEKNDESDDNDTENEKKMPRDSIRIIS